MKSDVVPYMAFQNMAGDKMYICAHKHKNILSVSDTHRHPKKVATENMRLAQLKNNAIMSPDSIVQSWAKHLINMKT